MVPNLDIFLCLKRRTCFGSIIDYASHLLFATNPRWFVCDGREDSI